METPPTPPSLSDKKAEAALAKISILVVDSDKTIRDLVTKVLEHLGFKKVTQATSGFAGIKILRETPVDIVITDWELNFSPTQTIVEPDNPEIDWGEIAPDNGANFVKHIRAANGSPFRFVPIIMLTGPTTPNAVLYARDAGVNEVLMKPLDSRNLCNRLINIIDKPRPFVTDAEYQGPCRRRKNIAWGGREERRVKRIEVIKFHDHKKMSE